MSDFNRGVWGQTPAPASSATDPGLRKFMLGVYNKLILGLILAGGIAWTIGNVRPAAELMFRFFGDRVVGYTPLGLIVAFAPLAIILFSNFFMRRLTPVSSAILYWVLVSVIGASMAAIFVVYQGADIASAFLITAAAFGGLSLFGYITKRNLQPFASFLIMGVWGVVIAGVASFFIPGLFANPAVYFVYNAICVLLFSGMIAWKTQALKETYYQFENDGVGLATATNYGALTLFISVINLFRAILAITGGGRR